MKWEKRDDIVYFMRNDKFFCIDTKKFKWAVGTSLHETANKLETLEKKDNHNFSDYINIVLHVTNHCNLHCSYCYAGMAEKRKYIDINDLKFLINILNDSKLRRINFIFHGGEPLFDFKRFSFLVDTIAKNTSKEHRFYLQTNGTLFNSHNLTFFKDMFSSISISIDGYEDYHNKYRKNYDNAGSFETVIKNYHMLVNAGIPVVTNSLLTSTADPDKLFDFFLDNGIYSIKLNPVTNSGRAIMALTQKEKDIHQITQNYIIFIKKIIQHNLDHDKTLHEANLRSFFYKITGKMSPYICSNDPCGMGNIMLMLDENGILYPCEEFYGINDFKIGYIKTFTCLDKIRTCCSTVTKQFEIEKSDLCNDCPYLIFCGGMCLKRYYMRNHDICFFQRETIQFFLNYIIDNLNRLDHIKKML